MLFRKEFVYLSFADLMMNLHFVLPLWGLRFKQTSNHKQTYPHLPLDIIGFWSFFLLQKIITKPRNLNLILQHRNKYLWFLSPDCAYDSPHIAIEWQEFMFLLQSLVIAAMIVNDFEIPAWLDILVSYSNPRWSTLQTYFPFIVENILIKWWLN